MARKIVIFILIGMFCFLAVSCEDPVETVQGTQTPDEKQSVAPQEVPEQTAVQAAATPELTPTPVPSPTAEVPDPAGSGDVLFDIYQHKASVDIDMDGGDEQIEFTAGEGGSQLIINGEVYTVPHAGLAQLFAVTDMDTGDGILELVFTDSFDPALPEGTFAFSWLYWWNGAGIIGMGGLMDVKFAGGWRGGFNAAEHFDGQGMVTCLTDTDELTYIMYMGHYEPSGSERKLKEILYTTVPVGEPVKIKCKQPCLLLEKITKDYYNSAYDFYWIPTLWPYTAGRVPNVAEGISIIAQTDEYLTIVKVYGKLWYKLQTHDGYSGWIRCDNGEVDAYAFTMGWDTGDMFSGL